MIRWNNYFIQKNALAYSNLTLGTLGGGEGGRGGQGNSGELCVPLKKSWLRP